MGGGILAWVCPSVCLSVCNRRLCTITSTNLNRLFSNLVTALNALLSSKVTLIGLYLAEIWLDIWLETRYMAGNRWLWGIMTFKQRQHHLVSIVNIIWCQLYSQEVVAVVTTNLSTFQVITIIRTVTNFNRPYLADLWLDIGLETGAI